MKLTEAQIQGIKNNWKAGKSKRATAKEYGVSRDSVSRYFHTAFRIEPTEQGEKRLLQRQKRLNFLEVRGIRNLVAYYDSPDFVFLKINLNALANEYGVSYATIRNIVKGKTYKGV